MRGPVAVLLASMALLTGCGGGSSSTTSASSLHATHRAPTAAERRGIGAVVGEVARVVSSRDAPAFCTTLADRDVVASEAHPSRGVDCVAGVRDDLRVAKARAVKLTVRNIRIGMGGAAPGDAGMVFADATVTSEVPGQKPFRFDATFRLESGSWKVDDPLLTYLVAPPSSSAPGGSGGADGGGD